MCRLVGRYLQIRRHEACDLMSLVVAKGTRHPSNDLSPTRDAVFNLFRVGLTVAHYVNHVIVKLVIDEASKVGFHF